jgi:hypothetical protein
MLLKALAERFAVDDSAVSQGAKRLKRLRSESPKLDRILRRIEEGLISNR